MPLLAVSAIAHIGTFRLVELAAKDERLELRRLQRSTTVGVEHVEDGPRVCGRELQPQVGEALLKLVERDVAIAVGVHLEQRAHDLLLLTQEELERTRRHFLQPA